MLNKADVFETKKVKHMKNLLKFIEISKNFLVSSINIQKLIQINVKIFPTFFKIFCKITLTFLYS